MSCYSKTEKNKKLQQGNSAWRPTCSAYRKTVLRVWSHKRIHN